MAHPTLSALKTQKTPVAATRVFKNLKVQQQRPFPKNCPKQCLIFSSAVYNHIMFCITKQRKVEKNLKQKFKLELKILKNSACQNPQRFFNFKQLLKIFINF